MPITSWMPVPKQQFFSNAGLPLVNGTVHTYVAGTNNPKATYADLAGTIAQPNPIPLNGRGEPDNAIHWSGTYDIEVRDALGNLIYTVSDYNTDAGADDGAAGTLFTTVSGFIAYVLSSAGSSIMGFIQSGVGAIKRSVQAKLRETAASVKDYGAVGDGVVDDTAAIQRAIDAHSRVHIPTGVYVVDASIGIKVKTSLVLFGDGAGKSILYGKPGTGGSIPELVAYTKGGIIRRDFDPAGINDYVNNVYMCDFGIVMNHPDAAITTTAIQIGFDMRNITASTVERCHVGNIALPGGLVTKAYVKEYAVQGYAAVFGTVSGSDPAYGGGQSNRFLNNQVYGAFKCVTQDESTLSPASASYGTLIQGNNIQTGHWLIGQMGQYGAGNVHVDNILQDIIRQNGNATPTYVQYYDGYNNVVRPMYIEAGGNVDYQLYLDTDTNNNQIDLLMAGVVSGNGDIIDNSNPNSYNRITYYGETGIGRLIELYNKAPRRCWVKFHWDGADIIIDGQNGVLSVTRTGAGDYLVTWATQFPSANYSISTSVDTNISGHPPSVDILSHSSSNVRLLTSTQMAAVGPTYIDPRYVWLAAEQI